MARGCGVVVLLLPLLPFYIIYRDIQIRTAKEIHVKARLTRREYVDRMGWLSGFEVYGRTVTFEAGKIEDPPAEGTVGVLAYRAWQYISFTA